MSIERAVATLSTLDGWDSGSLAVVLPLLQQVPQSVYEDTLAKTFARRATNPPGMLVHLLRVAIGDWRQTQNEARLATWDALFGDDGIERVKAHDADRYVLAWATPPTEAHKPLPDNLVLKHVVDYVWQHTPDAAEQQRLLLVFVRELERRDRLAGALASASEWVLLALDRDGMPLDGVEQAIATLTEGNPAAREKLLGLAREIDGNLRAERGEQAA